MQLFTRTPLSSKPDLTHAAIGRICELYADESVQRAAAEARGKLLRLVEFAALRSEIAAAINIAADLQSVDSVTPTAVVAAIRRRCDALDEALDEARADRDVHDQIHKARQSRLLPLRRAVSNRITPLANERESCVWRLDALHRRSTMTGSANNRHASLVAVGLTPEQINALGPDAQDPAEQAIAIRGRMAAIDAELALLRAFHANENCVTPLAGLGFDELVAARTAAERVSE